MGDEQADNERQQAEGGQVEVETVGEALQAAIVLPRLQFKVAGNIRRQRPGRISQQQTRQLPRCVQQRLRVADVHHDDPGCQRRLQNQRRQQLPFTVAGRLPGAFVQLTQGVWPNPGLPGRADERLQVECLHLHPGNAAGRRQAQRLDADQSHTACGLARQAQAPFQHRRNSPAQPAQFHVQRLIEALAIARYQLRLQRPGQYRAGPGIVAACLAVQCLHTGPQGRGQPQASEDAEALHTMAPPVAEQRQQGQRQKLHQPCSGRTRPACR
ncbi:hypothetical protein D9M71_261460 [compost metagenome]